MRCKARYARDVDQEMLARMPREEQRSDEADAHSTSGQELGMHVSRRRCITCIGHGNNLVPGCLKGWVDARERRESAERIRLAKCVHRESIGIYEGGVGR